MRRNSKIETLLDSREKWLEGEKGERRWYARMIAFPQLEKAPYLRLFSSYCEDSRRGKKPRIYMGNKLT